MNQIIENSYIKTISFRTYQEANTYVGNHEAVNILALDETYGCYRYCCVGYHSLTKEKQYIISFSSDYSEVELSLLHWGSLLVLNNGKTVYLIDDGQRVKAAFDLTTPLVGLFLISNDKLLVLEVAYLRVVDCNGDVVQAELFDLIEEFSIDNGVLSIKTGEGSRLIDLN